MGGALEQFPGKRRASEQFPREERHQGSSQGKKGIGAVPRGRKASGQFPREEVHRNSSQGKNGIGAVPMGTKASRQFPGEEGHRSSSQGFVFFTVGGELEPAVTRCGGGTRVEHISCL